MSYEIVFARSASRELERLEKGLARRLLERIEALGQDPRPHGSLKLTGRQDLWRIRSGEYRVVYRIDDTGQLIDVIAVRHRRDAYQ